jgi:hypothetical protein
MTDGLLTEVLTMTRGSATTAACSSGATTIPIENPTDFDETGGRVQIAGVLYDYTAVDVDAEELTLAAPGLTGAVVLHEPVLVMIGDNVGVDYYAIVDDPDDDGEPVWVPLRTRQERVAWPVGVYNPPLPVTMASDQGSLTEAPGVEPEIDGGIIQADTVIANVNLRVGDESGQRVEILRTPVIGAYNSTNEQTVNIDGEQNFMQGTIATDAADQPRVEVGQGSGFSFPAGEVRFYTEHAEETAPGVIRSGIDTTLADDVGLLEIEPPELDAAHEVSALVLRSGNGADQGFANLNAETVDLSATDGQVAVRASVAGVIDSNDPVVTLNPTTNTVTVAGAGGLTATMDGGGIGSGAFRDSVRAAGRDTNVQTGTTYTLALTDSGKVVQGNHATGITITIPANSTVAFPVGTVVEVLWRGAGTTTVATAGGVTLNGKTSGSALTSVNLSARYGMVRLWQRAADAWIITGDFV